MGQTRRRYHTFVNTEKKYGWGKCSYLPRVSMDTQSVFPSYNTKHSEKGGRSGHTTVTNKIRCFLSSYLGHPYTYFQNPVKHAKPAAYYLQYVHCRVIR